MNPTSGGSATRWSRPDNRYDTSPPDHFSSPRTSGNRAPYARRQIEVFDRDRAGDPHVVTVEQVVQQRGVELAVEHRVRRSERRGSAAAEFDVLAADGDVETEVSVQQRARRERPGDAPELRSGDAEFAESAPKRSGRTRQRDLRRVAQRDPDQRRRCEYARGTL